MSPKKQTTLYDACGNEIIANTVDQPNPFGTAMPDVHVFVQNDAVVMHGFAAHGAKPRLFGTRPMVPGVNVLRME